RFRWRCAWKTPIRSWPEYADRGAVGSDSDPVRNYWGRRRMPASAAGNARRRAVAASRSLASCRHKTGKRLGGLSPEPLEIRDPGNLKLFESRNAVHRLLDQLFVGGLR